MLNVGDNFSEINDTKFHIISVKASPTPHGPLALPYRHFIEPFKLTALVNEYLNDVNIIHLNDFADAGLIKAMNSHIHMVYTVHGRFLPRNSLYYLSPYYRVVNTTNKMKMKNAVKHADAIITVDSAMDPELYYFSRKYSRKVFLIPNGVDTSRFKPGKKDKDIREMYGIPPEATVIISTSRFTYQHTSEGWR